MNPQELYRAGRLSDAIKALSAELRDNPTDVKRRTFLFELLCFAGEWERADKQLEVLGEAGPESEMGVMLYRSALFAERQRHNLFEKGELPEEKDEGEANHGGQANGKPFAYFSDADPRTGGRLELFAAGNYLLLPLEHVASIQIPSPQRLRDLLWTPAAVRTAPSFKGTEHWTKTQPRRCLYRCLMPWRNAIPTVSVITISSWRISYLMRRPTLSN